MKDHSTTNKVNQIMSTLVSVTRDIEGYSVISDDNQNPHTSIEIYFTEINLSIYQSLINIFLQEFKGNLHDFVIPRSGGAHDRLSLIIHIDQHASSSSTINMAGTR